MPIMARNIDGEYEKVADIVLSDGTYINRVYDKDGDLVYTSFSEIIGGLPITFKTSGKYLTDYRISGNTFQNGTPSPEHPVPVMGCGERTENLFDGHYELGSYNEHNGEDYDSNMTARSHYISVKPNTRYVIAAPSGYIVRFVGAYNSQTGYVKSTTFGVKVAIYDAGADTDTIRFVITINNTTVIDISSIPDNTLLISGSTAPDHYIPYGYKIPVTDSDGVNLITTPVYIGSEPLHKIRDYADYVDFKRGVVVRRIKKLVLTGEKKWHFWDYSNSFYSDSILGAIYNHALCVCTHYENIWCGNNNTRVYFIGIADVVGTTDSEYFKSYLAAQYEAGTPVTVWYVLAEPEEEQLDLSAIQTLKGTNILTADTEVQPSEMYIKYKR